MLEFEEYKVKLNNAKPGLEDLRGALKLESAQKEIEELEAASEREGFWNDVEKSQKVQKRLKTLKNKVENFQKLCAAWDDMYTICEMAIEENDDSMLEELESEYKQFSERVEETRLGTLLTGEYDANNASPSMPVPAAPRRRTGPRCSTVCTICGQTAMATRSGSWTISTGTKPESRARR